MKLLNSILCTKREDPAEADVISHKLMLKAGLIYKVASGVYSYMPLGLKVLKNIENIIREEMNKQGSEEFLASTLIPSELWKMSGRWQAYGPNLFRLSDRNNREFCLGPTHEEIFTDIAKSQIKSYRQLPVSLYQIQTKFRDEIRPRFGVMRSREFLMKDAYSFDKDEEGLNISYNKMYEAYNNIFTRCKLIVKCVEADSGSIGGSGSAEFIVKSDIGEDKIAFCSKCDYASNVEKAQCFIELSEHEDFKPLKEIHTPDVKTINELVNFFNTTSKNFAKTIIYKADDKTCAVMVRGDRDVNEIKVINALSNVIEFNLADPETVYNTTSADVGFAGPIGLKCDFLFVDNEILNMTNFIIGANHTEYHFENANYERDFTGTLGDFRNIVDGDKCPKCGAALNIAPGIEVGHIFKLGTKYSKPMEANFIDENGNSKPFVMGCYGIGVNRTMAAILEQNNDDKGIIWPMEVAPYKVIIIPISINDASQMEIANKLYDDLNKLNIDTILDDREERCGVKFMDADLLGIPIKIIVGKSIKNGNIELKERSKDIAEIIPLDSVIDRIAKNLL